MGTATSMRGRRRQGGAIAIVIGISIVTLVLMIGLVLDLSHLFIVKHELQNAADACALSGARELTNLTEGALERATGAAVTAGAHNRAQLQRDAVAIDGLQEVKFSDAFAGPYEHAITPNTKYVRCSPHETNPKSVAMWFMQVAGIFERSLSAEATAKVNAGEALCAIPIAMCTLDAAEDFVTGQWYSGRLGAGTATTGMYDWVLFQGQSGASDPAEMLSGEGFCARVDKLDGKGGSAGGITAQAWNTRFGLYGGTYQDPALYRPDWTGYAFTPSTWPNPPPQNAYPEFLGMRTLHRPYAPGSLPGNLPGGAAPIAAAQHEQYGRNRRMVAVPIIRCHDWAPNKKDLDVVKWACALMIAPITGPDEVRLEFRGLEGTEACAATPTGPGTGPLLVK